MAPKTLSTVKLFLRRTHDLLDADLAADIEACLADLQIHGVVHKDDTDPLILNAIKLWCKANDVDDTVKAAEYRKRYVDMRDHLKAAEGYGWEAANDE